MIDFLDKSLDDDQRTFEGVSSILAGVDQGLFIEFSTYQIAQVHEHFFESISLTLISHPLIVTLLLVPKSVRYYQLES